MPGRDLHAGVGRRSRRLDERPGRRPVVDVEDAAPRRCDGPGRRRPRRSGECRACVASATCTAPPSPSAARLARATSTRSGSRSTPAHGEPGPRERDQVAADAAAEVDAPTSGLGRRDPRGPVRRRPAARVACSRPSGVKYIRAATVAELRRGRGRAASTWVSAAATCSGVRRTAQRGRGPQRVAGVGRRTLGGPASRRWPGSVSSQRKASRSTRRILSADGSEPTRTRLALAWCEC